MFVEDTLGTLDETLLDDVMIMDGDEDEGEEGDEESAESDDE